MIRLLRWLLVAFLVASAVNAQQVTTRGSVMPVKPGQVQLVATYFNANGKLVSDTILISVLPVAVAPVASVEIFNAFLPPRFINQVTVGRPFCAFAQAKDSVGNVLTGRAVTWTVGDTSIAKLTPNPLCPDTTVRGSLILANPIPPER